MRKRNLYWLVLVLLFSSVTIAYVAIRGREPSYEGRPLSRWLEDCDLDKTQLGVAAQAAVRQIGPSALPTLLRNLGKQDSSLKRKVMGNCLEFRALGFRITAAKCCQVRAAAGCRVLGPKAEAAIPALIMLLPEPMAGRSAAETLTAIGPEALIALTRELTNPLAIYRSAAAAALIRFGTNAVPVIPALAALVDDPDAKVRRSAAESVGTIGSNGGVTVVAALTKALGDDDALVRRIGVAFLAGLGAKANETAPALSNMTRDSDPEVRRLALIGLKRMERPASAVTVDSLRP